MHRWQFTAILGATALAALVLSPALAHRGESSPPPPPGPATPPPAPVPAPPPAPVADSGLTLSAGLDNPAVLQGETVERTLVITIGGAAAEDANERPINVAVVMDRSGSMSAQGKMEYAREAARELVGSLHDQDRFGLVTFSDRSEVELPMAFAFDRPSILARIAAVREGGGTNLYDGLDDGLRQVVSSMSPERVNRVIVLSDGNANVGLTSPDALGRLAAAYVSQGVSVSTIGLGLDYNEDVLAAMADRGGGSYHFVNHPDQLAGIFESELQQMNNLAAPGVDVHVKLDGAELVEVYGYEATHSSDGFTVRVGDLYGGQTRKVVARVRVRADQAGSFPVATVVASSPGRAEVKAPVNGVSTTDRALVDRSEVPELAIPARKAESAALADKAVRAWASGDVQQGNALLKSSELVAGQAASRYDAPELEEQAADLRKTQEDLKALGYIEASAPAAQEFVKENKEVYRDWSK